MLSHELVKNSNIKSSEQFFLMNFNPTNIRNIPSYNEDSPVRRNLLYLLIF